MDFEAQFDAYLENRLSEDERATFEQALAKDEQLNSEFEAHKAAIWAIHKASLSSLKDEMNEWETEQAAKKPTLKYLIGIAASVILLVSAYFVLSPSKEKSLYSEFYSPYPNIVAMRGETNTSTQNLMQWYSSGDYKTFISKVDKTAQLNDTLSFYCGIAYMQLGQFDAARLSFDRIDSKSAFASPSIYYAALSFLAENKSHEAILLLKELESEESDYSKKAKTILKHLN